jgi:glutaredoxin
LAVLLLAVAPLVLPGEARGELNTRSWWGLALLTTAMAVFSLVLLGLMVFKIQAFCPFCLLSALLSLTLMVLSLVGGAWEDRGQLVFRVVMTALAVAVVSFGWATAADRPASVVGKGMPMPVVAESSPAALALADQLTKKGVVMYSAYWCPHCHEQKELFGKQATAKLNVVECAPDGHNSQAKLCATKNIQAFPSWEINGKIDSGVKPLAKLAELIGYRGGPGL